MDTKSKNRHKLGIILILGVILLATVIVLGNYNTFYKNAKKEQDSLTQNYRTSESFMKTFIRDCYVLYSKESGNEYNVKFLDDYCLLYTSLHMVSAGVLHSRVHVSSL